MLVLPFFLVAVSGVAPAARGPVAATAEDAEASAVGGELTVFEARRFRGFAGAADVAARAPGSSLVAGGWLDAIWADILVGDVAEADDLCRLCAGGDLNDTSSEPLPFLSFFSGEMHETETERFSNWVVKHIRHFLGDRRVY